ncbi:unnamed protein product [Didymodactylos carnosus]|uniref:Ubiquitin-like domain-containing protein n=1 Tax=Didymodactylos carnosus TaxID=1234261 RepID=A0A813RG02_9BILA|nr:unnamed protein product [Didymodactylos carnosus]CAF1411635.1 unnamed protein product [Didymodactylos carnosus]CAF3565359.1 unnamed protein product [Didymodactylos carnosus]CAF4215522.1 unnamed protein product [Didymodactylos carnosus]
MNEKLYYYTKLQVHFGGDIQEVVLKTQNEPTSDDLSRSLQHNFRIPIDEQRIYYRGQRLHNHPDYLLSRYGIFNGNTIKLIGKRSHT